MEIFQIPFKNTDLSILICNSNVRHELSSSEYPIRREQCKKALELMGLKSYRDASQVNLSSKFVIIYLNYSNNFIKKKLIFN